MFSHLGPQSPQIDRCLIFCCCFPATSICSIRSKPEGRSNRWQYHWCHSAASERARRQLGNEVSGPAIGYFDFSIVPVRIILECILVKILQIILFIWWYIIENKCKFLTSMHSSRMPASVSATRYQSRGVSVRGRSLSRGETPSRVNRMTDTRFWKHYLPATLFAGCIKRTTQTQFL